MTLKSHRAALAFSLATNWARSSPSPCHRMELAAMDSCMKPADSDGFDLLQQLVFCDRGQTCAPKVKQSAF